MLWTIVGEWRTYDPLVGELSPDTATEQTLGLVWVGAAMLGLLVRTGWVHLKASVGSKSLVTILSLSFLEGQPVPGPCSTS